jgi:hypothetical protein
MNSKRAYMLTIGLLSLLCIGIFVTTFFAFKVLTKESDKLVDIKLQNRLLDEQQTALISANKLTERYASLDSIARSIVPQDKDQAKAVREIVKIADETGIKLGVISFPASTLGALKPKVAAGETPSAVATPAETQVKPVSGIPGVYVMEITISQDPSRPVSYTKFIDFMQRLENNRRTAQVSNVTIQPLPQDRNKLSFSMIVNAYIKP